MAINIYYRSALIGGGVRSLDIIPVADLQDGDMALVFDSEQFYAFQFDSNATDAESSPVRIRPDDYSTSGVWKIKRWSDAQPVGVPMLWLTDTPPSQYMLCNGAAISRTVYPELFAVIGTCFGEGDGSTTFNLPNPQGLFPRFTDNGAGVDPDASSSRTDRGDGTTGDNVGTKQGYATARPNTSFVTNNPGTHTHGSSAFYQDQKNNVLLGSGSSSANSGTATGAAGAHTHTITGGGDSETRPKNMYFNLIIKYE